MLRVAAAIAASLFAFAGSAAEPAQAPAAQIAAIDRWTPIRFLLGTREGTSSGQPGSGTVRREYRLVLRDQFIEVRNTSTYLPQEKNPKGEVHEDVGYISYDRSRKVFVFRQFHVEGFVTTYITGPNALPELVFTSETLENLPSGWRARETYRVTGDNTFVEVFELAEPGKEFSVYSETRLSRRSSVPLFPALQPVAATLSGAVRSASIVLVSSWGV
jgi:hypothetical protein